MQEKLIDLESRIAFQEESIDTLSRTISDQQKQIDHLSLEIVRLLDLLEDLTPSPPESSEQEPPPPHY